MGTYAATVRWSRNGEAFIDNKYSRGHEWSFDGGVTIRASSSPQVVPRFSDPKGVDPEEAFVASLSSCHMLTFLSLAAVKKFIVDSYVDEAIGMLAKNAKGKLAMTEVILRPKVVFSGENRPGAETLNELHHRAHEDCFIANSVTTNVRCEPITGS
ncbi:MAG TPA: OsmC family protein [Aestuariivirgaceae bacterium]|nr:OsmC family protein [Aestuariivirgaceae bacterium]